MNTSYLLGEDEEWSSRYYFTYYSEFGDRKAATVVEIAIMLVTFVIAVFTNLSLATCVLRYDVLRTPTNLCLVNLAAADLLFALGVSVAAYTRITQSWTLGETVCKLLPYSQMVCGFVLLWTLTLISMDRHRCLAVAPYRSKLTVSKVIATSLFTWVVALLALLPVAFWFKIRVMGGVTICTLIFPRSDIFSFSSYFIIFIFVIMCLMPMGFLIYHYQRIFRRILNMKNKWRVPCVPQKQENVPQGRRGSELSVVGSVIPWASRKLSLASIPGQKTRAGSLSQHEELRLHKHVKVIRILLLNVVAVLLMWLPINAVMILIYVDGSRPTEDTNFFLRSHHFVWALITAHLNTIVNPLLYGVISENFRKKFCFVKFWTRENQETGSGSEATARKGERSGDNFKGKVEARTSGASRTTKTKQQSSNSDTIGD